MTETETATGIVNRSLKLGLQLPAESDLHRRIVSSINQYRAALRHCYGILVEAHDAAADITWTDDNVRVSPSNANARIIAALATRQSTAELVEPAKRKRGDGNTYRVKIGRGAVYELRAELVRQMPEMMSYVIDSARRDIQTAWQARDPQYGKASRGWLTLQGARGSARFTHRGIGLPVATAKPRLEKRGLVLRWDRSIGEVEFGFGNLDSGALRSWMSLRDGDWKLGTVCLSERDGKLFSVLSHSRPDSRSEIDPARKMSVSVLDGVDTLMRFSGPDGAVDVLDACAIRSFLEYAMRKRLDLEARRGANGSPRRPWGNRKTWQTAQTTLGNATQQRERRVDSDNHAWSRRLVSRAVQWRCGVIEIDRFPVRSFNGGNPVGCIGEHPWNWSDFEEKLRYKATEQGIAVVVLG